jgi:xeroderma pigmentosum group C-complementing protein
MIHKSRIPDQNKRGRLFEVAITHLTEWWSGTFFEVTPTGHIRNRTFDQVQRLVDTGIEQGSEDENEVIRNSKSLMKHALMGCGSRDVSAQLFTALCRALDIPARLVVSLQSVPWQASVGRSNVNGRKKVGKGKQRAVESEIDTGTSESEDVMLGEGSTKGKARAKPVIRLRKSKKGHKLGSPSSGHEGNAT